MAISDSFPADHDKLLDDVVGLGQDGTQQGTQAPHYSQDQSVTIHLQVIRQ